MIEIILHRMKKILLSLALIALSISISAQNMNHRPNYIRWTVMKSWSQGFNALPDVCTNLKEFNDQYNKNQTQWNAMFKWLATTDLKKIPAGQHKIPNSTLIANVQDDENKPLEMRKSESHYNHIDFQYVVKGTERFGLIDHDSSYPLNGWKPDMINYKYDVKKTMFIDSTPEHFFLFFPSDWHIALLQTNKTDQHIRVIVIKVDYIK